MLSLGLRSASLLRSSLLRAQNVGRLPTSSLFTYRSLSTSLVNYGPSSRFVYLGNLPWSLEIEDIKEKAERFGSLASIDMPDENGRPAGFSNIEFDSPEDADSFYRAALDTSLSFEGRKARVELFDEPQKEVVRGRQQKTQSPPSKTIFIGRIPFDVEDADLHDTFSPFGDVKRVSIAKDPSGARRGFGHIEYGSIEEASAAMNALNNSETTILGQHIHLDFAPPKPRNTDPPSNKLYFSQFDGTLKDMEAALRNQSGVSDILMLKNRNGIIQFSSVEEATAAKEALDQTQTPDGHTINIFFSKPRPKPNDNRSGNMRRSNSYGNDW
ncbi:hypothetical protein J3R30DRAFT_3465030 [Lentinula aciculospora]|uniref:RRM domain-containing protein n=1 Tax=Lentinula aciculospora TaxID=153920 RepID=A0A9W9AFT8_9AGAR|nr:hypothetical protein J3R30DRAFT_3465030 [Lentinula aciculospora]